MIDKRTICCFTGHRPEKLPWGTDESDPRCAALKRRLDDVIRTAYDEGMRHFICGMARGSDLYCAELVLALRQEKGDVVLEAAIPCPTQAAAWPAADRPSWTPATWRRWSRSSTPPDVCSGATDTWSIIVPSSSPSTTAPPGARGRRCNTP